MGIAALRRGQCLINLWRRVKFTDTLHSRTRSTPIRTQQLRLPEHRIHGFLLKVLRVAVFVQDALHAINEHSVSYRWTHRESSQSRIATVKGLELLRLFLQHVLPRGFRRVRHFGYLSAAAKDRYQRLRVLF